MSTPAVGQIIDDGNVDEFLLPPLSILVDEDSEAWQLDVFGRWYSANSSLTADSLAELADDFGPVEVAWLPPVDPTPHLAAVQESLERRAA